MNNSKLTEKPLFEIQWENHIIKWKFQRKRTQIYPTEIIGQRYFIAVSLKNPNFSNLWLNEVLSCIRGWRGSALLTLVDLPYLATLGIRSKYSNWKSYESYYIQAGEQKKRLDRIAASNSDVCTFLSWETLQSLAPTFLFSEFKYAFAQQGDVYEQFLCQVESIFTDIDDHSLLRSLASFLIHEMPTLTFVYYEFLNGCIDVYPGKQAEVLWNLDLGFLRKELKETSNLILNSSAHTFACTELASA